MVQHYKWLAVEVRAAETAYVIQTVYKDRAGIYWAGGNGVRVGDRVVLCQGSRVPLVFRRVDAEACGSAGREGTDKWRLVCDAYVHRIMEGEEFEEGSCERMMLV